MTRGSILQCGNEFYLLVRVELADTKNGNGTATGKQARYNLVNISTGKTRVSNPERLFLWMADEDDINLNSLKQHFGLDLVDTGITCEDLNLKQVVSEAIAQRSIRAATIGVCDPVHMAMANFLVSIGKGNILM